MTLAHGDERRLRVALVGCGRHAFRSVLPTFDYTAVELVATCDFDRARAEEYARRFGARAACGSLAEAAARGDVEAAVLVVGPGQHPDLACEALGLGLHVWMEKPPSADVAGVDRMIRARDRAGRNVVVGLKKAFMPGLVRMKGFVDGGALGAPRTVSARFPVDVPPDGEAVLAEGRFTNWLANGVHPLSAMVALGGRPDSLAVTRAATGGGFLTMRFPSGAVGSLHMTEGQSYSGALERYEVVCEKGHAVLENNSRLTVHRPGYPFDYGGETDFAAGGEDSAALVWEPQNTLSTLENKAIFLQGFVQEVGHFVTSCLEGRAPTVGTLEFARAVMECYEAALLSGGAEVALDRLPSNRGRGPSGP